MSTGRARLPFTILELSEVVNLGGLVQGFDLLLTACLGSNSENVLHFIATYVVIHAQMSHDALEA